MNYYNELSKHKNKRHVLTGDLNSISRVKKRLFGKNTYGMIKQLQISKGH
jgi:hypothetical protein